MTLPGGVTFPYGVQVALDDYGIIRVREYKAYDDIGNAINPALTEGRCTGVNASCGPSVV